MPHANEISAEALAGMSSDELDRLLGQTVLTGAMYGKIPTPDEVLAAGREYFLEALPVLRERLCGSSALAAVLAQEHKERNTMIAALADLLHGISPVPVVLAARVLHYGYDQLCPRRNPTG